MDTSHLAPGPVTWAGIFAFAVMLFVLGKAVDWLVGKMRAGQREAVSPLAIELQAVKIQASSLGDQLNAFKVEVARTYVTGDVITRLERRIDDLVTSVRDEMAATRREMLQAFAGRPPG